MSKMKWKIAFVVMLTLLVSLPLTAQAGTFTSSNAAYAVEALTSATVVTLPNLYYTLGVARTSAQGFTVIYTLPSGVLFNATPAAPTILAAGAGTTAAFNFKRGGANSNVLAYDVAVAGGATAAGDVFQLNGPTIKSHGLASIGGTVAVQIEIKDGGETAFIDNPGALSTTAGNSVQASNFWNTLAGGSVGVAADTLTTIDVGAATPLTKFLAAVGQFDATIDSDTAPQARAGVAFRTTLATALLPTGAAAWTAQAGDLITMTVTDPTSFSGLTTLFYDLNGSQAADAGEIFSGTGTTRSLSIAGTAVTTLTNRGLGFICNGTTVLGTSRILSIAGGMTPTASGGAAVQYTGLTNWWTWGSNGIQLFAPLFQTTSGFISRFVLTNIGTTQATFTISVQAETGNTPTLGTTSGTIPGTGMLVLDAGSVVTGWTAGQPPRGQALFTINAPSANIQGLYQIVSSANGSISNYVMKRPATN